MGRREKGFGDTSLMPRTRADAIAVGAVKYFTGEPCLHGHIAPRYTSMGGCLRCLRPQLPNKYRAAPNVIWPLMGIVLPASSQYEKTPELVSYLTKRMLEECASWYREYIAMLGRSEPTTLENIIETQIGARAGGITALTEAGWLPVQMVNDGLARRMTEQELRISEGTKLPSP